TVTAWNGVRSRARSRARTDARKDRAAEGRTGRAAFHHAIVRFHAKVERPAVLHRTAGQVCPLGMDSIPADCAEERIHILRTGVIQPEDLIAYLADCELSAGIVLPKTCEIETILLTEYRHGREQQCANPDRT